MPSLAPCAGASLTELAEALTSSMVVVVVGAARKCSGDCNCRARRADARFSTAHNARARSQPDSRQVDICGVFAQVCLAEGSTSDEAVAASDQRHCSATLLDWAGRSATQQRAGQGPEGFTLQFAASAFSFSRRLLQAHPVVRVCVCACARWLAVCCARGCSQSTSVPTALRPSAVARVCLGTAPPQSN